jgi:hypothetical protein
MRDVAFRLTLRARKHHLCLIASFGLFCCMYLCPTYAEQVDPARIINNKLMTDRVDLYNRKVTVLPAQYFQLTNVRVIDITTTYGEVTSAAIPDQIEIDEFLARNCTSQTQERDKTVQIQTQEGLTVKVSKSVLTQSQTRANIGWKSPGGSGASIDASRTVTVSFSEDNTSDHRRTVTVTEPIKRAVPPFYALFIRGEKRVTSSFLPFKGAVLVDADIWYYGKLGPAHTPGEAFAGRLSEIYPDPTLRTFEVAGEVWNAVGGILTVQYSEVPLDKNNPAHCPPIPGLEGLAATTQPTDIKIPSLSWIPSNSAPAELVTLASEKSWKTLRRVRGSSCSAQIYRAEPKQNGSLWDIQFSARISDCDNSTGRFDYLLELEESDTGVSSTQVRTAVWGPTQGDRDYIFSDSGGGITETFKVLSVIVQQPVDCSCMD